MAVQGVFRKGDIPKINFGKIIGVTRLIFLSIFVIIFAFIFVLAIVPAGHVGIEDVFGVVAEREYQPGLHVKFPWVAIVPISVKTQEIKEVATVPSQEGLLVTLETSILYKLDPTKADEVYKTIGRNYEEVVINPQLRSVIREVTANYEAKALYTSGRETITQDIFDELAPRLTERGIILEKVLLRDLGLPQKVTNAIEQKLEAEQEAQRMEFILEREEQEAERKRIEAKGIKDSQEIIALSLTEEYLQWYWIQRLNENPNVIYVATEAGLPIFKEIE